MLIPLLRWNDVISTYVNSSVGLRQWRAYEISQTFNLWSFVNISKFWEKLYPFSVINLPDGIQGPIYNILSLPKGVRSSAAMKYRISKFLNPMGAVYLLRRWRIASVTADQYQTNRHRVTHIYRCQQNMPSLARAMACNLSGANLFNHHHNRCRLIVLWKNVSNYNQNAKTSI